MTVMDDTVTRILQCKLLFASTIVDLMSELPNRMREVRVVKAAVTSKSCVMYVM